jgi:hypothetical protein
MMLPGETPTSSPGDRQPDAGRLPGCVQGGNTMAGNKLTIKLTDDQQNQIKSATGKSITELNIDVAAVSDFAEKDLDHISGGFKSIASDS